MNREQAESILQRIFKHSKFHDEQWETGKNGEIDHLIPA